MSLKAWYPLDGNLEDYSGNGNTLVNNSTANITVDSSGKIGKCYNFTGTSYLNSTNALEAIKEVTYAAWVNRTNSSVACQGIVNNFNHIGSTGFNSSFNINSSGQLRIDIAQKDGTSHVSLISTGKISENSWNHVACYLNYETGDCKFYINGTLDSSKKFGSTYYPITIKDAKIMIGQWGWAYTSAYKFIGKLNDIRIYDEELSLKEIKEIAKAKILHYNFNQKNDTRVSDASGFRNHSLELGSSTAPQWTESSILGGGCYKFNGTSHIAIGNKCKPTDAITISTWVYKDNWNTTVSERVISCTEAGGWQIGINDASGSLSFQLYTSLKSYLSSVPVVKLSTISAGWHHVVGTFDGRYAKLYLDGVLKATSDVGQVVSIAYHATNGVFIGAESGTSETSNAGSCIDGCIDDVRIYSTAITAEDVLELYQTRASVAKNGKVIANEIHEDVFKIKIVDRIKATIGTEGYKYIYTGVPTGETDVSTLVETDKTLGETYLQGYLYISSLSYPPGNFEYTIENDNKGFTMALTPPKNGWSIGWNYFSQKVTGYINAANTDWSNMNRLQIYHSGAVPSAVTTEYLEYKDVYLVKKKDNSTIDKTNVNKKGQLNTACVNEVSRRIRYVRDYLNGSTANTANHWVELQVISNDINIAKGITPTSSSSTASELSYLTDENYSGSLYARTDAGLHYMQVDLGEVMDVDYIKVWHYYADGRTYHSTKTQVSVDGTTWITLFDSATEGEYVETSAGKTHYLYKAMPYYKMYKDGSVHTTEIIED